MTAITGSPSRGRLSFDPWVGGFDPNPERGLCSRRSVLRSQEASEPFDEMGTQGVRFLVSGLVAVGLAFFIMKRFMKRASTALKPRDLVEQRREDREGRREREEINEADEDEDAPPLPRDLTAALQELERRGVEEDGE